MIIKPWVISHFTYISNVTVFSKTNLIKLNKKIIKYSTFLEGKPDTVNGNTLFLNPKNGGRNMTDIQIYYDALKLNWAKRL